ncbi:conserved hypothetical protein [Talaromyces stipitatus ATCC 10500]|uniref:Zn(2)-C6 fungal-type domain-containing protein n=1 Tax=Talaromyces stipitatus (strain ATCC 10500 / CBS 375.48 / QM 6759 / NRRL 1006) TaxID=441959 RepID=B8MGN5_TALSN|nr:uncharacterized protein TSTA_018550 [Talaromyces stipitatus ATCC 10500]EED16785.1 conserved hypothetical protein [Talaromyces stipitatus ATCC 10500]
MTCVPCRTRKKKCDKGIPGCGRSRCLIYHRIGINCRYDKPLASTEDGNRFGGEVLPCAPLNIPRYESPRILEYTSNLRLSTWTDFIEAHLTNVTLATLTSRGRGLRSACLPYLETLNEWLPVVLPGEVDDSISSILSSQDSESSLLLYSCYLLSQICGNEPLSNVDELYFRCKGFFTLLVSQRRNSEKLVQIGLLLSLYEYLQAMIDVALTTIASSTLLADHIGLFLERDGGGHSTRLTSSKRIWWSLFILERVIMAAAIDNPVRCGAFTCPAPPVPPFPVTKEQRADPFLSESHTLIPGNLYLHIIDDHTAEDDLQLEYFTRLVQACYLLELALLDRWAHPLQPSSSDHCIDLDRKLTTFASAVLQEGEAGRGKNCSSLAICVNGYSDGTGPYQAVPNMALSLCSNNSHLVPSLLLPWCPFLSAIY